MIEVLIVSTKALIEAALLMVLSVKIFLMSLFIEKFFIFLIKIIDLWH